MKIKLVSRLILGNIIFIASALTAQTISIKSPGNHRDIQPAIQAAVDKAANGDTIILPAGEFVINKSVVINKFISVRGQGLKKTILCRAKEVPDSVLAKSDWLSFFNYNINSNIPSGIVVADICFRGRKPMVVRGDGGARVPSSGVNFIQCVDFIIERCRFEYFGNAGILVTHNDTLARGLIRHNEFYYNAGAGLGYGIAVYGTNDQWVTDAKLGSDNFIFIEDNIFDFHRHSVAAGGGGLYVFRYNTVLNNIAASGGHAIDTHEARRGRSNKFGTRAVEVYHNKIFNTTYTDGTPIKPGENIEALEVAAVAIRSGDAVVYDNEVKGYRYAARLSNWFLENTIQSAYPIFCAPGYLSGTVFGREHTGADTPQGDGDAFFWNNTNIPFATGSPDTAAVFRNYHPNWWQEGRDYHLIAKPGYKPYPYPYPVKKH